MRIGAGPLGRPEHVAEGLRAAAARLGHRPALTVLLADRRDEQGFASLHKWTAKGAHLLVTEVFDGPGGRVGITSPPGWPVLTVCLATWWTGGAVSATGEGDVAVIDADRAASDGASFVLGRGPDGAPERAVPTEAWVHAARSFPDDPPPPAAAGDAPAVVLEGRTWDQSELIDRAAAWGSDGPLGVDVSAPAEVWLPALVRPLLTGLPTVVVDGATPEAVAAENVTTVESG